MSLLPTNKDIDELIAFLPKLYAEGFKPVKCWRGGDKNKDGVIQIPWPEYENVVIEFFHIASKQCWKDYNYTSNNAVEMIKNKDTIKNASLEQIKTMITLCVRRERFCEGIWESVIEEEIIRSLLERLQKIRANNS